MEPEPQTVGTPHDVLELLENLQKKTDVRRRVFAIADSVGDSRGTEQGVGYGIQQKLREGFSSAESFLSVREPAFDPEIRISRCYHDPLDRLRTFCLAF